ncbi:MAG: nucleotidyltransferase domain-containing protein [bacterium]
MDKREVIEKVGQYKLLVSRHFDVYKVFLFGSYAKGTQQPDSDIDVAIIVNNLSGDYFTYAPLLWKLRREIDERIEPVLIEKEHDAGGFAEEVLKTGILID